MFKKIAATLMVCLLTSSVPVNTHALSSENQSAKVVPFNQQTPKLSDPVERFQASTNDERGLRCQSKSDREIKKNLENYLNAVATNRNFHGTVLVEKDGRIILNQGYGMANYEENIPNTSKTRFAIASMTKQFTAMAIMQLYEQGKLQLDAKLSTYFPDFANGKDITLHQLLTHTSGIPNYIILPEFWSMKPENLTEEALVNLIKDKPLGFKPGEAWQYSNSNYLLLGMIVEKVSSRSLDKYFSKNIFKPLGMKDTGVCFKNDQLSLKTIGYKGFLDITPIDDSLVLKGLYGAGNLYSTVEDLYLWDRALYSCKLVKKRTLDLIFSPQADTKTQLGSYGYGWIIQGNGTQKEAFHDGAALGFNSIISRYLGEKTGIIILSNNNHQYNEIYKIKNNIHAILLGQQVELPQKKKAVSVDDKVLEALVGTYEIQPGVSINIIKEGSQLYELTSGIKSPIFPKSETEYFYRSVDVEFTVIKNEKGEVEGLLSYQLGQQVKATKLNTPPAVQELKLAS